MSERNASDLHLKAGQKPTMRVATALEEVGRKVLSDTDVKQLIYDILTPEQVSRFERDNDLDIAYSLDPIGRFRISVFRERGNVSVSIRRVKTTIPAFEELNLPSALRKVAEIAQGLVIVAGPTGCGKSTTLACLIEYLNRNYHLRIITIEDPVEYLFQDKKSYICQREIGIDAGSFRSALKHIVRQDPDVILIGEMRDYESFEAALLTCETGHLVFTTIHAASAPHTIGRILDLFPTNKQPMIRQALAFHLKAVVCQKLLPALGSQNQSAVPAVEIMLANPTIQKLIQSGEDSKLHSVIRSASSEGMQDFNQSLLKLVRAGLISKEVALQHSPNPEQLKMNLKGIFVGDEGAILT
jgi:twitching motility protein PilT